MPDYQDWQVPPQAANNVTKLGWINESTEEGQNWLKSQRGYGDFTKSFEALSGRVSGSALPKYRSNLRTDRLKRNARELVGAIANIRPLWGYGSGNPEFSAQDAMMNKTVRAIYLKNFMDRSIKEALQWSLVTSTGWINPVYRRKRAGHGSGELMLDTYGAPSVLPVQLPMNNDWQEAYCLNLMKELPIYMAHGMFPEFQDQLKPTSSKYWYSSEIRQASQQNALQRIWNKLRRDNSLLTDLYIPIRYSYINDLSINKTKSELMMGPWSVNPHTGRPEPVASWSYKVPYVGQQIQVGEANGYPIYRVADENDARVYPYRRLIISSETCIMYDGPAYDWHGEAPLVPVTLEDWAWEAIGLNILRGGIQIQDSINQLERGVMDKHAAQLDPSLAYDINAVTRNEALTMDPMQPRGRAGFDGSVVSEPFKLVVPPEVLKVDGATMEFIAHLESTMDHQMAIRDVVALAKARALGGTAGDLEKIMEADGPVVRDISRNVEQTLSKIGDQVKYLVLQYFTAQRLMRMVGASSVTTETFDFDPASLIPSHMPGENPNRESFSDKIQRARYFAANLECYILPHTAHEITQMTHKLGLIQLKKAGVKMDSRTLAESWDVDYGTKPEGNTPYERAANEMIDDATQMIRVRKIADSQMMEPAIPGADGGPGKPPMPIQQKNPEGRPPSGQVAPHLESKDGGARSTIAES